MFKSSIVCFSVVFFFYKGYSQSSASAKLVAFNQKQIDASKDSIHEKLSDKGRDTGDKGGGVLSVPAVAVASAVPVVSPAQPVGVDKFKNIFTRLFKKDTAGVEAKTPPTEPFSFRGFSWLHGNTRDNTPP